MGQPGLTQFPPRIEDRTKVLIRAGLRGSGAKRDSCILDVSSRGMLLTMADPPGHGAFVEVLAMGHEIVGQVEWAKGRRFGIRFRDRINHAAFIAGYDGPIVIREAASRRAMQCRAADAFLSVQRLSAGSRLVLTLLAGVMAAVLLSDVVRAALGSAFSSAEEVMTGPVGMAGEPDGGSDF